MKAVKVLVVDDSSMIRAILSKELAKYPDIEIVGTAEDPYDAREKIVKLKPDVITLDIVMPKMDGIEFVSILMKHYPLPIIIVSSVVDGKCDTTMKALSLGAFDVIPKQNLNIGTSGALKIQDLHDKIIVAAGSRIRTEEPRKPIESASPVSSAAPAPASASISTAPRHVDHIIAIGASTGGPQAIESVLAGLPGNLPPIVITQHLPSAFTTAFAHRLNSLFKHLDVQEAIENEPLYSGMVRIAKGNFHLHFKKESGHFKTMLKDGPKIHHQRPAVDIMFYSLAEVAGTSVTAVLLTGMGEDGADGLLKLHNLGAATIAQNEASCVVYGMPKEAIERKAAQYIEDLDAIPKRIIALTSKYHS